MLPAPELAFVDTFLGNVSTNALHRSEFVYAQGEDVTNMVLSSTFVQHFPGNLLTNAALIRFSVGKHFFGVSARRQSWRPQTQAFRSVFQASIQWDQSRSLNSKIQKIKNLSLDFFVAVRKILG